MDHSFLGCMETRKISSLSGNRTTDPLKPVARLSCESGCLHVYLKLGNHVKHSLKNQELSKIQLLSHRLFYVIPLFI